MDRDLPVDIIRPRPNTIRRYIGSNLGRPNLDSGNTQRASPNSDSNSYSDTGTNTRIEQPEPVRMHNRPIYNITGNKNCTILMNNDNDGIGPPNPVERNSVDLVSILCTMASKGMACLVGLPAVFGCCGKRQ